MNPDLNGKPSGCSHQPPPLPGPAAHSMPLRPRLRKGDMAPQPILQDVLFSSPRGKGEHSDGYENVIKSIAKPAESGAELAGGGGAARRFPSAFPGFEGSSAASAEVCPRCSRAPKRRLSRAGDPTPAHFSNFIHKRGQAQAKRRDPRSHPLFPSLPVAAVLEQDGCLAAAGSSPDPFLLQIFACSKAIGSLGPEWEAGDSRLCDLQGRTAGGGAPHTQEFRERPAPLRAQRGQGLRVCSFTPRRGLRGRSLCGPAQLGYPPPPGGNVFLFFQCARPPPPGYVVGTPPASTHRPQHCAVAAGPGRLGACALSFVRGKRVAGLGEGENSAAPKPPDLGRRLRSDRGRAGPTRVGDVPPGQGSRGRFQVCQSVGLRSKCPAVYVRPGLPGPRACDCPSGRRWLCVPKYVPERLAPVPSSPFTTAHL
ncbi:hypothetical protein J1605_012478 [Eschrichtius robustus]|uniref:Uncharacterized protein n=1 Tax=Eschrichtius robustus TaxID=9764 RepID=A0AB34GJ24_ESCRO|nr:hypothetical protein J1605_012478 [Eschrichtius robustus]